MNKLMILPNIFLLFLLVIIDGCIVNGNTDVNYREEMRKFVEEISLYAKNQSNTFVIVPQNGHELITENGQQNGEIAQKYIDCIDGIGREDLFYGYYNDNEKTPEIDTEEMLPFMNLAKSYGLKVLITDYCWDVDKVNDSYIQNYTRGYISFAASHRNLDNIPTYPSSPYNENDNDITKISDAQNFLYLINPDNNYNTKVDFINALIDTNYDLLIIDLFFNDEQLTNNDILSLKLKKNGHKRLVLCYMSIGEAEDYRYYWQKKWELYPPSWLVEENPEWPGNYKVKYWLQEWKRIIYGTDNSYLDKILSAGFDGVYLDIIDAYEFFENKN